MEARDGSGPFESRSQRIWASAFVSWLLIGGAFACCLWFWFQPPLPGVAVAVLGGAAAVMAFRDMHSAQKLLATVAIFALMGIELSDIRADRIRSDSEQAAERESRKELCSHRSGY